jgi:hypothetical protein
MNAHEIMLSEYRAARLAQEMARDIIVGAYGSDSEEWREYPPPITFKEWLINMRTGQGY